MQGSTADVWSWQAATIRFPDQIYFEVLDEQATSAAARWYVTVLVTITPLNRCGTVPLATPAVIDGDHTMRSPRI